MLLRLGDATQDIVLIGGQAIAFWANYYNLADRPLTSKDIDFCGGKQAARLCAIRLHGAVSVPDMDKDPATPNSALVKFVDDKGNEREIDFLDQPFGLEAAETRLLAQEFDILDESGGDTGTKFSVMHPLHCVVSRASNTANLPGYDGAHALEQLRFSVRILRAFIVTTVLETYKETRGALKLIQRLYASVTACQPHLTVFEKHGVDVFEGAPSGGLGSRRPTKNRATPRWSKGWRRAERGSRAAHRGARLHDPRPVGDGAPTQKHKSPEGELGASVTWGRPGF